MADPVDISSMPDPSTIGLSPATQADPTAGMPAPEDLFRKYHGLFPEARVDPDQLKEFMANPPGPAYEPTLRKSASMLTGLPRAATSYALAVPAGVASVAGQASGALGAALDPDDASNLLEQGRERGRQWAEHVSKLADYVPATKRGAALASDAAALPGNLIKQTVGDPLKQVLPDNAYQAVSDVAQDVGNDLPALGAPAAVRGIAKGVKAGATAAKGAVASEAATLTPQNAEAAAPLTPPVGEPITGDSLRAQPNPIPPPEGTKAHAATTPTTSAEPTPSTATQAPAQEPTAQVPAPTAAEPVDMSLPPEQRAIQREGVAAQRDRADPNQRGSVRLFNSPADEGPKETPAPEQQDARAASLDAVDHLSGGGLPTRRLSAINGDYNATGDDWQAKEVGSQPMRQQIASENAAMHSATENVHASIGSEFENSVDSTTLGDRGRGTRGAIQGIEKHFDDATDGIYDVARAQNQGKQIPALSRVKAYLDDDSNFTNDAEIGLQRAAKQRLDRLWSSGDPDHGTPPGSVNAAERFREFLNEKGKNPSAMGVAGDLKNATDMDVSEHGGPGLFETARAMRRHSYQMLEEPVGIKKLLTPGDSQGINHAIPEHKVMDYIADLPREQHEHVLNVLRAGAHLGSGELAESSAAALREIQAHVISRMHNAATNADGSWNARKFYNSADRYARNAPATFKDRPDVLNNLKTINDAGNTLAMDKHYPGAGAQIERTGMAARALAGAGGLAASIAHEIPMGGRMVGRAIERGVESTTGKMTEAARDKAIQQRLVDRTGKQRGAVGYLNQRDEVVHEKDTRSPDVINHRWSSPNGGKIHAFDFPDTNARYADFAEVPQGERGKGTGTRMLQRAVDDTHADGKVWRSDKQVSESQAGAYANLKKLGYDVKMKDNDHNGGAYHAIGDHVFEVRPGKQQGSTLNVGLHQGQEGQPGFRKMSKQEAQGAVESTGAKVTKSSVLTPEAHGVPEPTAVLSTNRPLAEPEMQKVLAKTKQSAIPQRTDAGVESMHVAPGHEEIAKREGWDKFNPDYFRDHEPPQRFEVTHKGGSAGDRATRENAEALSRRLQDMGAKPEDVQIRDRRVPAGQRGSFSFQNDNELNRATASPRAGQRGGVERNPRSEYNANNQMAGERKTTSEQQEILRRLSGQRGSVRVMNEKPLAGAPDGDRPNGVARAAAASYKKSAGIDTPPLKDYRFVDPKVAKNVADAYEAMPHDPSNPKVARSYDAFKAETLAQYKQMQKAGVKVDLNADYPYKNPREMHADVRDNNHMSVYPTESGFGAEGATPADHPLLEKAPVKMGGKDATYNDLFRAVHDYYGHAAEGNGFRANGEYNAWRAHRQMYSPEARGAMDAETLGQNSWVNSGPAAALNKGASGADTIYADQKAGLLPKDVVKSAEEGVGADEHHITNQLTDKERGQLRTDTTKRLVDAFNSAPATKEYAAAALAGAAKRGWYKNSAQAIVNQFGPDAPRFAGLLSAMSPQVSVQTNFANALKTFVNWDKAGRPEDPGEIRSIMEASSQKSAKAAPGSSNVLDAWVNNSVRALTADDPTNIKLSGPKVHSFYHNLTNNVHEVTNDAWMASFAKIDPSAKGSKMGGSLNAAGPGKSPTYLAMSAKVRDAARTLSHLTGESWTPAEVQETVWSWAKTAYEHAEEMGSDVSIPDLVKKGAITDELIRSTPDFHQLFSTSEHRGLLQSSRFAGNAEGLDKWQSQGTDTAGTSKAREAAAKALRPALISAAERLESVRQERRAAGKSAPKEEE